MEESLLSVRPTLVRRVSDLIKDAKTNNGSKLLFNNKSMQKIRHCCQNLGYFPYLFYSFSNSKSLSNGHKLNLNLFINRICEKIFALYTNNIIRQAISCHFSIESYGKLSVTQSTITLDFDNYKKLFEINKIYKKQSTIKCSKQQKKNNLLICLVYLIPIVLLSQLIGLLYLLLIGKFTPGFIFLLSSLLFLGFVLIKILSHQNTALSVRNYRKRKFE